MKWHLNLKKDKCLLCYEKFEFSKYCFKVCSCFFINFVNFEKNYYWRELKLLDDLNLLVFGL